MAGRQVSNTMKAVLFERFGPPEVLQLRQVPIPEVRRGEVLVRVVAAALNPLDAKLRQGRYRLLFGSRLPRPTGHDFAGTVVRVGPGVSRFRLHEPVYGMLAHDHCGSCAEYVAVPVDRLARKPDTLSFIDAAALPLAALTALQALSNLADVQAGQQVFVYGASGGVGTAAVQIAQALGAQVDAACGADSLGFVQGLGARQVHDYHRMRLEIPDKGYDCWLDASGTQAFDEVQGHLAPGGCFVTTQPSPRILLDRLRTLAPFGRRARLVTVHSNTRDLQLIADWVDGGLLRPVIAGLFPLNGIADAHRQLETGHTHGKLVVSVLA